MLPDFRCTVKSLAVWASWVQASRSTRSHIGPGGGPPGTIGTKNLVLNHLFMFCETSNAAEPRLDAPARACKSCAGPGPICCVFTKEA